MTAFTIQASKNGQTITTVRIRPTVCVEKAKTLLQEGWQVQITDAAGHQYGSGEFDELAASAARRTAPFDPPQLCLHIRGGPLKHPAR
jgi:hypothetical protein